MNVYEFFAQHSALKSRMRAVYTAFLRGTAFTKILISRNPYCRLSAFIVSYIRNYHNRKAKLSKRN